MSHANILSRFIALVIDSFVVGLLILIIQLIFGGFIGALAGTDSSFLSLLAGTAALIMFVVLFALQFVYFGYFWSTSGQTPGMRLMSIKVVDQQTGQPLSFVKGALRGTLGYYISGFVFCLGYIWAIFDENNETWHDKIFSTSVVVA